MLTTSTLNLNERQHNFMPHFKPDYARTFQAWSMDGYKIIKGSKAVGRSELGEPLFSPRQVVYTRREPSLNVGSHWDGGN